MNNLNRRLALCFSLAIGSMHHAVHTQSQGVTFVVKPEQHICVDIPLKEAAMRAFWSLAEYKFNQTSNRDNLYHLQSNDNRQYNNAIAVAAKALEILEKTHLSNHIYESRAVETFILAAREFIQSTAGNYALRKFEAHLASKVMMKFEQQLERRFANQRLNSCSRVNEIKIGVLKDYIGERLEKELDAIAHDIRSN